MTTRSVLDLNPVAIRPIGLMPDNLIIAKLNKNWSVLNRKVKNPPKFNNLVEFILE